MNIILCHGGDRFLDNNDEILCPNAKWCLCHNMLKYQKIIHDEPLKNAANNVGGRNQYGGGYITMGPGSIDQCFPNCSDFIPIYKPYRGMIATIKKWRKCK